MINMRSRTPRPAHCIGDEANDPSTLALAESPDSIPISMEPNDPLAQAESIATAIEQLADQLRPEVIRAARGDASGQRNLDRIEYALGTIGKALILTDYSIDEEKDMDKLKAFRESQQNMG